MITVNIRAYKVFFPDGRSAFEENRCDGPGAIEHCSVRGMTESLKYHIDMLFRENNSHLINISIDLRPYHDIYCPVGLAPRRCFPLNKKESDEFWFHFNALTDRGK